MVANLNRDLLSLLGERLPELIEGRVVIVR
jgi:hypothetical protein